MGYNKSYGTIRRMESYLEQLRIAKETIAFPAEDPRSLAYKIREALFAAQFHPDKGEHYEEYAELKELYKFEERDGRVVARWTKEEMAPAEPMKSPSMEIEDVETVTGIAGALVKYEEVTSEIRYPNAILTDGDKLQLLKLAEKKGWKIIDHGDMGVTFTKKSVPEEIIMRRSDL